MHAISAGTKESPNTTQKISMQFSTFAFPVCVPKNILILSDLAVLLLLVSERDGEAFIAAALFPC